MMCAFVYETLGEGGREVGIGDWGKTRRDKKRNEMIGEKNGHNYMHSEITNLFHTV